MSKKVIASINKKSGSLEHGDEYPKRISQSQVSDLVFKETAGFLVRYVDPKDPKNPPN